MKSKFITAPALALTLCAVESKAATVVLDFEGLGVQQDASRFGVPATGVLEQVSDFYNGGAGGNGSSTGQDFSVSFSDNALAIVDADAVGLPQSSGNFGGEPSPSTVLFFLQGTAATINYAAGFTTGFSFYYSSFNFTGSIDVYSGLNSTGTLLASLSLPTTPFNGAPDPTGDFSPFVPLGVSFAGVAKSIDFGGTINQIGFDNITFGSATPGLTPTTPVTPTNPAAVPIPAPMAMLGFAVVGLIGVGRRRDKTA